MTPLATLEELITYLGAELEDEAQASLFLTIATGTIQDELGGQLLVEATDDEFSVRGSAGRTLWLPQRPVTALSNVRVDGGPVLAASTYRWDSSGRLTLYSGAWSSTINLAEPEGGTWGGAEVLVTGTYSHGYATIPPSVRGICLALATRGLAAPDAGLVTQESLGAWSASYAREAASTLTRDERRRLRRYKRQALTMPVGHP